MTPVIDAHHHFWKYSREEYGWIDDSMARIRRDFLPEHLQAEIAAAGIDGVVSVQAQQTVDETGWLLAFAEQSAFIRGVVGWAPLVDPNVAATLEQLAARPKLKAIRHVIQSEPDDNFILRPDLNRGVSELKRLGLVYDILIFERHLPQTIEFVDRHPNQRFVLDHIAKPRIRAGVISPWRELMRELARRENVYCKLSGVTTEADYKTWTEAEIAPYLDVALEAFGPKRLMFGSDWPVCLVAVEYSDWANLVRRAIGRLSKDEQARVMGGTAVEAYGL